MINHSIELGVCKFNVNTEVRQAYMRILKTDSCASPSSDLLDCMDDVVEAMKEVITEKLVLFGSAGKAHLHQSPYAQMLIQSLRR